MRSLFDLRWGFKPLLANPDPGGGDGGGPVLRPAFSISPAQPYAFGNTTTGTPVNLVITITNTGTANLIISAIVVTGTGYSFSGIVIPKTIAPSAFATFTLTFVPPAAGSFNGTCTITHNATGTPYVAALSGSASNPATGGGILSWAPSQLTFPDTTVNTSSLPQVITLSNIGTGPLSISSLLFASGVNFSLSLQPQGAALYIMRKTVRRRKERPVQSVNVSMKVPRPQVFRASTRKLTRWMPQPYFRAQFPIQLAPGDSIQISVIFTPLSLGLLTDVLNVQTDLQAAAYQIPVQGNGVLLIPVAIITDNTRALLFSYINDTLVVNHLTMNPADLNSEVACAFIPNGNLWNMPGIEKQINQIEFFYENLGVATLTVSITSHRPSAGADNFQTVTSTMVIGTALADGTERSAMCDLIISGEILTMTVSRAALGGPVSLIGYIPHFEERGEKVENS